MVRWGFIAWQPDSLDADPDAYRALAQAWHQTGIYGLIDASGDATPTAFRPPLYPWTLSWIVSASGELTNAAVAAWHVALGIVTVALTCDIARRLGLSAGLCAAASILVAIDPILLSQSSLVMTETMATLLGIFVWWCWVVAFGRRCVRASDLSGTRSPVQCIAAAAVLGGLLSLCILCRPTFLVWSAMIVAAMMGMRDVCWRRRLAMMTISTVVIAATVGLWMARNQRVLGKPVWATSHGGYTLLLGNNDDFYQYLRDTSAPSDWLPWNRTPWDADAFFAGHAAERDRLQQEGEITNEIQEDAWAYSIAKRTIQSQPGTFVASAFIRVGRLWHPFPMRLPGRGIWMVIVVGLFYVVIDGLIVFAVARAVGSSRCGLSTAWIPWWPAAAMAMTLTAVHAVYWSNARMRSPVIPMASIAAMAAFVPRDRDKDVDSATPLCGPAI